ncbi:hypothetical protein F4818DRAFT_134301 [Hypoxylon cercidicola]|nr:hypothetical protein F4818DRAFT_134301 [Hypoxylon cercidicola]
MPHTNPTPHHTTPWAIAHRLSPKVLTYAISARQPRQGHATNQRAPSSPAQTAYAGLRQAVPPSCAATYRTVPGLMRTDDARETPPPIFGGRRLAPLHPLASKKSIPPSGPGALKHARVRVRDRHLQRVGLCKAVCLSSISPRTHAHEQHARRRHFRCLADQDLASSGLVLGLRDHQRYGCIPSRQELAGTEKNKAEKGMPILRGNPADQGLDLDRLW